MPSWTGRRVRLLRGFNHQTPQVSEDAVGLGPVGSEAVMTPGDDAGGGRRQRDAEAAEAAAKPAIEIDEAEMQTGRRDDRHASRRGGGRPFGQRGAGAAVVRRGSHDRWSYAGCRIAVAYP